MKDHEARAHLSVLLLALERFAPLYTQRLGVISGASDDEVAIWSMIVDARKNALAFVTATLDEAPTEGGG